MRAARQLVVGVEHIAMRMEEEDSGFAAKALTVDRLYVTVYPLMNLLLLAPLANNLTLTLTYLDISLTDASRRPRVGSRRLLSLKRLALRRLELTEQSVKPFAEGLATLCPNVEELRVLDLVRGTGSGWQNDVEEDERELMEAF